VWKIDVVVHDCDRNVCVCYMVVDTVVDVVVGNEVVVENLR